MQEKEIKQECTQDTVDNELLNVMYGIKNGMDILLVLIIILIMIICYFNFTGFLIRTW